jgi:hypothetical protein
VVTGAGTTTRGFAGAVRGLATTIAATRFAAGLVVVAEWLAGAAGGLAATTAVEGGLVTVARTARGLAGAVRGLAIATAGSARLLLVVAEAAAHHVHASELGAHVFGRVGVSLGGPGRAASAPVILGVWNLRSVKAFSCKIGRERLTGLSIAGWLLALRLGSETRLGGELGPSLVLCLRVRGIAVHVSLLHASVVILFNLGDEVGVHDSCWFVVWWMGCWKLKRWMEDAGKLFGRIGSRVWEGVVGVVGWVDVGASWRGRGVLVLVDGAASEKRVSFLDDDEVSQLKMRPDSVT